MISDNKHNLVETCARISRFKLLYIFEVSVVNSAVYKNFRGCKIIKLKL